MLKSRYEPLPIKVKLKSISPARAPELGSNVSAAELLHAVLTIKPETSHYEAHLPSYGMIVGGPAEHDGETRDDWVAEKFRAIIHDSVYGTIIDDLKAALKCLQDDDPEVVRTGNLKVADVIASLETLCN